MTENKVRHYANTFAEGMGITFYVVNSICPQEPKSRNQKPGIGPADF